MLRLALLALAVTAGAVTAQSNTVVGLDGRLEILDNITYWARRGPTHPGGEVGLSMRNTMCNPGSVNLPWFQAMAPNHPKFGFLIVRESGGRLVQISDWSYCKHAFTSASVSGGCGTCDGTGGSQMGLRCSDTYNAGHNAGQSNLGPPGELDPWLGTWVPVGSYFDRGDPDVGPPQNTDGIKSLTGSGFDGVKNRVTVKEADLLVPGASYYYGIHLMHAGEAVANRGDNLASRGFVPSWNGSTWSVVNNGVGQAWGSILQRWSGATVNNAGNGNDDGRFFVAVKVTPSGGQFHYEYAVHNVDNNRGGASLRIPVSASATVSNFGFKDIDGNALNQWSAARVGNEIVFSAAAGNPLNWNTIYNFWFDCTQAPGAGLVHLDEARPGPGNLTVSVQSQVPSDVPTAFNTNVGTGCTGSVGPCVASVYQLFPSAAAFDLSNSSWALTLSGNTYTLGAASGAYVAPTGLSLPAGDDMEHTVALPFAMPIPGGTINQVIACSNGFISPASNGTTYNPTSGELLSGGRRWAAAWHDLNPSGTGVMRVDSSPSEVRVTWLNVPNYGGGGTNTFQYRFQSNGTVSVYYLGMSLVGGSSPETLVGYSPGGGSPDPGNSDLSAVIPTGLQLQLCGAQAQPLALAAGSRPVLGTQVAMTTSNIPSGSGFAGLLYSFTQAVPPIDLTAIGMPGCNAYLAGTITTFNLQFAPGASVVDTVNLPLDPLLISVPVSWQSITYSPPLTPFGFVSSNGVVMLLAAQ